MRVPRPHALRDYAREALWLLPSISIGIAIAAALGLTNVEGGPHVFEGSAGEVREVLAIVAGSVITVAATVFTLTVVALELASSNYSPRLLRNFLSDRGIHLSLSALVATFAYCIALLRGIPTDTPVDRLPHLGLAVAAALTLISLLSLVYFIHHMSQSIRIERILLTVQEATTHTVRRTHREPVPDDLPSRPQSAVAVAAGTSGYVQAVDLRELAQDCGDLRATVQVQPCVGDHVVEGTTIAWVWSDDGRSFPAAELHHLVNANVEVSFERTLTQDVAFGIRQLVDIAIRAISPAVNDPTTATDAIRHLAVILAALAPRPIGPFIGRDGSGRIRAVVPSPDFAAYLDASCAQIRRYGASEPEVLRTLLNTLTDIATLADDPQRRAAVGEQVELIMTAAAREIPHPADREVVEAAAARARLAAAGELEAHVAGAGP